MLERFMADKPGAFVWRRAVYDSADDVPTSIESLVVPDRNTPMLDVFTNRSSDRISINPTTDRSSQEGLRDHD